MKKCRLMAGVRNSKTARFERKRPTIGDTRHDDCTKTGVMSYAKRQ